jgi:hypothetical protein
MRQRVFVVLAAVVLLASCGTETAEITTETAETEVKISKPPETKIRETEPPETETQSETEEAPLPELVLVDEAGVRITTTGAVENRSYGPALKLLIENNSGIDLTVQSRNASVNGCMTETLLSADVVNGKKAYDWLAFDMDDLQKYGIDYLAWLEFSFHIFTSEGWDTYLDTEPIVLSSADADTYKPQEITGIDLFHGEGFRAMVIGYTQSGLSDRPGIDVYLENNYDVPITVQVRDVSVNGFMADALISSEIMPGKNAIDKIKLSQSELNEIGITSIEEMEFYFHVFDFDTWDTIVDTEPIVVKFDS